MTIIIDFYVIYFICTLYTRSHFFSTDLIIVKLKIIYLSTMQHFSQYTKLNCKYHQGPDRTSLTSVEMETEEKEMLGVDLAKTPEPSDIEEEEDKPEDKKSDEEKKDQKVSFFTYFKFLLVMINSALTSMTKYLNQYSNDYRYIRKVLAKEKKNLKVQKLLFKETKINLHE